MALILQKITKIVINRFKLEKREIFYNQPVINQWKTVVSSINIFFVLMYIDWFSWTLWIYIQSIKTNWKILKIQHKYYNVAINEYELKI